MRYASRLLARSPLFTAAAAVTLALGIGANTAMFSVLNAVLLRPLPLHEPERLAMLWESNPQVGSFLANRLPAAMQNVRAWRERSRSFSSIGTLEGTTYNLTGLDRPDRIESARVSTELFGTLGVTAGFGRLFTSADTRERVAVVTHGFAARLGGPAAALGKSLRLNGSGYSVIGVLPGEFHLPATWEGFDQKKPEIFVPRESDTARPGDGARVNLVYGRLKPGVSITQARAEIVSIARVLQSEFKDLNAGWGASVFPVLVENLSPALRRNLLILQLAVALVLLICCANIMNLLLARLAARERELAIRAALGAGRARMVAHLLAETTLIAAAGAASGWGIARLAIAGIVVLKPEGIHRLENIRLDPLVFGFTCLAAVVAALASGLIPALIATRRDPASVLGMQSRALSADVSGRVRRVLIACEVALGMVLLAGAGLMIRSMAAVLRVDPGFRSDAMIAHMTLADAQYPKPENVKAFCTQLLDRVSAVPGVRAAAIVNGVPLESISVSSYAVAGRPAPAPGSEPMSDLRAVSEQYFEALGMRVLRRRAFTRQEAETEAPVVMINESLARQVWPNEDPIGKALLLPSPAGPRRTWPVIGIVADSRQMGPETTPRPEFYIPSRALRQITLVVRASGDPKRAVTEAVWSVDRDLPVHNVTTVADMLHSNVSQRRFNMVLLAAFAGLALVLAAVGVYGVVAYTVAGRTREIGIRMALGARGSEVLRMIVAQSMRPVATGLAIGLAGAFALARAAASLFFGVSSADPLSFAAAAAALAVVAGLAALVPAQRAARLEPTSALRME